MTILELRVCGFTLIHVTCRRQETESGYLEEDHPEISPGDGSNVISLNDERLTRRRF